MTYKIVYTGRLVSSNTFYAGGDWRVRNGIQQKWHKIYSILFLEAKLKPFKSFDLRVLYNSRHDVDNISANVKLCADSLKGKYIKDDSSDYFQSMSIRRDKSLPKNTIEFYIDTHD